MQWAASAQTGEGHFACQVPFSCEADEIYSGIFTPTPGDFQYQAGIESAQAPFSIDDSFIEFDPSTGIVTVSVIALDRASDGSEQYDRLFLSVSCGGAAGDANLINSPLRSPRSGEPVVVNFLFQDARLIDCVDPLILVRRERDGQWLADAEPTDLRCASPAMNRLLLDVIPSDGGMDDTIKGIDDSTNSWSIDNGFIGLDENGRLFGSVTNLQETVHGFLYSELNVILECTNDVRVDSVSFPLQQDGTVTFLQDNFLTQDCLDPSLLVHVALFDDKFRSNAMPRDRTGIDDRAYAAAGGLQFG